MVLAAFVRLGKNVSLPFGDASPYDMILDEGKLVRIQGKTGVLKDDFVAFNTRSDCRKYAGLADLFAVYCPQNGKIYLVPIEEVGSGMAHLRLTPAKSKQQKKIHWAKDYEFGV